MTHTNSQSVHFQGKNPLQHVVDAQVNGLIASAETHGIEIPGHLSAGADTARESVVLLCLVWQLFETLKVPHEKGLLGLALFALAWSIWKIGRASWLAWARLERLHRVIAEEQWEIEHHRQQERDELRELYAAKGFQGKLLEEVLDVLMADGDRLLRVMIEEELGLSLEIHEHPLKQGVGAAIGALLASAIVLLSGAYFSTAGIWIASIVVMALSAGFSAYYEKNRLVAAMVWNTSLGILAFSTLYWLLLFMGPL